MLQDIAVKTLNVFRRKVILWSQNYSCIFSWSKSVLAWKFPKFKSHSKCLLYILNVDLCILDQIHIMCKTVLVLQDLKLCMWCKHCTQRISKIVKPLWKICLGPYELRIQPTFSERNM